MYIRPSSVCFGPDPSSGSAAGKSWGTSDPVPSVPVASEIRNEMAGRDEAQRGPKLEARRVEPGWCFRGRR